MAEEPGKQVGNLGVQKKNKVPKTLASEIGKPSSNPLISVKP